MANLYNRQGRTLSLQPVNSDVKQTSLEPITSTIVKTAANIAQENYALGNSIALHDSLEYAYNQAKDSPEQFNKLADSTIKTFADRLPSAAKNQLMDKFVMAKQKYAARVETNYYNKLDTEHTDKIYRNAEIATNGMLSEADTLYKSIVNRDDENARLALIGYKNSQANMKYLSESKNIKGEYVFNKSERETAQNTQTGHLEAFKRNVDTLSLDELKKFDSEIFQDKSLFQQKTGVDDATYADMSKYIKNRRTDMGDEEKRVIANQASFTATRLLSQRDPEEYENLKKSGVVPDEVFDSIDKIYKTAPSQRKVESAYVLEKTIQYLYDTVGDYEEDVNQSENMQKAIIAFGSNFKKFSDDNALDQEKQQEVLDIATRYISDKVFRESAKPLFEDTIIAKYTKIGSGITGQEGYMFYNAKDLRPGEITSLQIEAALPSFMSSVERFKEFGNSEKAHEYAQAVAHNYVRAWVLSAMSGDYEGAKKILQEGNRAVIIAANSDKIPEGEFQRMEKDLANGKDAFYTMLDGRTIQFLGYSNTDAIFKLRSWKKKDILL